MNQLQKFIFTLKIFKLFCGSSNRFFNATYIRCLLLEYKLFNSIQVSKITYIFANNEGKIREKKNDLP